MKKETLIEAVKDAPPISVGGLAFLGVPLSDWVLILTLVYTIFLLIDKSHVVLIRVRQFINWLRSNNDGRE